MYSIFKIVHWFLFIFAVILSLYIELSWKPFLIATVLGIVALSFMNKHIISIISYGLWGYIVGRLFIQDYQLLATLITLVIVVLGFWIPKSLNMESKNYTVAHEMSFLLVLIPTMLIKT